MVQGRSLLHADLTGGGVDHEVAGGRRLSRQRVAQGLAVVGGPRHGVANGGAGGGVLGDAAAHVQHPRHHEGTGGVATVPVQHSVGHRRCRRVHGAHFKVVEVVAAYRRCDNPRISRRGPVAQIVAVRVRELPRYPCPVRQPSSQFPVPYHRAHNVGRSVGRALANVRPGPLSLKTGDGPHLRLVRRACR